MKHLFLTLTLLVSSHAFAGTMETFNCGGTEPFWDVRVAPTGIHFRYADDEGSVTYRLVEPEAARGRTPDLIRVYRTTDLATGKSPASVVITKTGNCNNGMSDHQFPYSVLWIGEAVLEGCCVQESTP